MNELGNTPADKNYKPSGISKAKQRALEAYPHLEQAIFDEIRNIERSAFVQGYEAAEKDIKELIQYKINSIDNNRIRGYWLDAVSELYDIIDMIDG